MRLVLFVVAFMYALNELDDAHVSISFVTFHYRVLLMVRLLFVFVYCFEANTNHVHK